MLQILRKKAQSPFIQIIVVIIALVFIFWGVGTNMSGNRQAAIVVNDEEISFQEFQQAYENMYQRYSARFNNNLPEGMAESLGIKEQTINQLIQTTLLRQGAEKMGIRISSLDIRNIIEEMVQFQDNGHFSMERYKAVLATNRMAPTKFEDSMRIDKLSEIAAKYISNFAAITTDYEIKNLYKQINEKIAVKYLSISPTSFEDKVEVKDDILQEWYESVKNNYKTESEIKLKYLPFTYEDIGQKIDIDPEEIKQYYKNNPENFRIEEKRHARHILLKADTNDSDDFHASQTKKLETIRQKALAGDDFAELAKQYSEGPSQEKGGDLGFFGRGQMVPAFETAVFSLESGEVSDIIKTQYGYHIIYLEEIKPGSQQSLEEVSTTIKSTLQRKEAEKMAFQVANTAYESIITKGSLAAFKADNPDTEVIETNFFKKSQAPAQLKDDIVFLNKAFALNKNELSSLIKGQTGYAIFYIEDIKEPIVPPFNDVFDRVADDYKIAQSKVLAKDKASELLLLLQEKEDYEAALKEEGYEVLESGLLGHPNQPTDTEDSDFPTNLIEQAFQLSVATPLVKEVAQSGEDYFIYWFVDRQAPTLPEDDSETEKYKDILLQAKQEQIVSSWLQHLQNSAEITQHKSL